MSIGHAEPHECTLSAADVQGIAHAIATSADMVAVASLVLFVLAFGLGLLIGWLAWR